MLPNALREYEPVSAETTLAESPVSSLDVRQVSGMRPLAGDYAFDFARVAALYAGDPTLPAAWTDIIARRRGVSRPREAVAAMLDAQLARRGAPAPARQAAASLAQPNTFAIVTGQQAGAFGGPLYTLLKAITAIQLARKIGREQQADVVPVFWVDAEDHDWEEIASCTVLDPSFQPQTVTLPKPEGAGERPVAALTLDERIDPSLDALGAALGATAFTADLMAALRAAYRPGTGVADAFARLFDSLLGPHGLVVFDASDPAAKPFVADLFAREIRDAGRTASLAATAGDALAALGHAPQVTPQADTAALFHVDGVRRQIRRQDDGLAVGDDRFTVDALAAEATASPQHFSPNVLLRPIVQDRLFPTVAYVAGPSELAYLGQLRGVYENFGIPMPLMYPRATATIVDSATARFLGRYDIPFDDLQRQDESALNRLLEAQIPVSVETALRDAEAALAETMARVIEALPAVDPTLAGAARSTQSKMEHELKGLRGKMIQAAKRRDETLRRQFTRTQAQVFPLGHLQERTLGIVYFLNRYGPGSIDRLLAELPLELGRHWILTI